MKKKKITVHFTGVPEIFIRNSPLAPLLLASTLFVSFGTKNAIEFHIYEHSAAVSTIRWLGHAHVDTIRLAVVPL